MHCTSIKCFQYQCTVYFTASLGLTDDQREFQRVALDFAKNELAPEMQKWDQEVCDKGVYNIISCWKVRSQLFIRN